MNKLKILYLLSKLDMKLGEDQLLRINADFDMMSYMDLKLNIGELVEMEMIDMHHAINGIFYQINQVGSTTLECFYKEISFTLRQRIDELAKNDRARLLQESRVFGDSHRISDQQYHVNMKIMNGDLPGFEVMLMAGSQNEAEALLRGWRKHSQEVYEKVYDILLRDEFEKQRKLRQNSQDQQV